MLINTGRPHAIHPLLRGANFLTTGEALHAGDSSPPTRGKRIFELISSSYIDSSPPTMGKLFLSCPGLYVLRFIPSYEGQTAKHFNVSRATMIHPLLRGANHSFKIFNILDSDSSPPTRGKPPQIVSVLAPARFIPSYEGQTPSWTSIPDKDTIHPLLRGANSRKEHTEGDKHDSSPPTRGKHSVFMRLSAALNTTLCNLHKFYFHPVTYRFPCI